MKERCQRVGREDIEILGIFQLGINLGQESIINPNPVTHLLEQSKTGHKHRSNSQALSHSQD